MCNKFVIVDQVSANGWRWLRKTKGNLSLLFCFRIKSQLVSISNESRRAVKNRSTAVSCRKNWINNWMAEEETRGLVTKLNVQSMWNIIMLIRRMGTTCTIFSFRKFSFLIGNKLKWKRCELWEQQVFIFRFCTAGKKRQLCKTPLAKRKILLPVVSIIKIPLHIPTYHLFHMTLPLDISNIVLLTD